MKRFLRKWGGAGLPLVGLLGLGWGLVRGEESRAGEPRIAGRRVPLNADDVRFFPEPAAGFQERRTGAPRGRVERVEYDSRTVGTRRGMRVYTPPGYEGGGAYPVLYLLHGIGGDEGEWEHFAAPDALLDRLIADGAAVPMLVVMPNGRAQKDDRRPVGDVFAAAPAFAVFERDLLEDVIPAVEGRYRVKGGREHRAVAGLSMGGGQALNFGLGHGDRFAWVGGFSAAPNTRPPGVLVPDAGAVAGLRLLWLSCGSGDGLFPISQGLHGHLKGLGVPHVWHVTGYGHEPVEWREALYYFLQRVFQPPGAGVRGRGSEGAGVAARGLQGAGGGITSAHERCGGEEACV